VTTTLRISTGTEGDKADFLKSAGLLFDVFGSARFAGTDFLEWLYRRNPEGAEVTVRLDDEAGRPLGHFGLYPQTFHSQAGECLMSYSVHAAVAESARGQGVWSRVAEETYRVASQERGIKATFAAANRNSTHGFTGRLRCTLLKPLPVRIGLRPLRPAAVASYRVTDGFLSGPEFGRLVGTINFSPGPGWSQKWSPEKLAWRLRRPGGEYFVHLHDQGAMVSRKEGLKGLPIAVVLKVFPPRGGRTAVGPLLAAACKAHRTPFYLYAGFNDRAGVPGLPLPRRLLPAPLNLVYRALTGEAPPPEKLNLSVYEFLDFDAY